MNTITAVVLAWYFMLPTGASLLTDAPTGFMQIGPFQTAAECNFARDANIRPGLQANRQPSLCWLQ